MAFLYPFQALFAQFVPNVWVHIHIEKVLPSYVCGYREYDGGRDEEHF